MHSKVFVVTDNVDDNYGLLSEEELIDGIGCDYISMELEFEFKDSVKWLKSWIEYKTGRPTEMEFKMESKEKDKVPVAIFNTADFIEAFKNEKEERIKKIKEMLEWEPVCNLIGVGFLSY